MSILKPCLLVVLGVLIPLASCSDESAKTCGQCPANTTCNAATGLCQPVGGCPAAGCGANAICNAASRVCACNAGFFDCNRDLGRAPSNGCECPSGCNGAACGGAGTCSPGVSNACGSNNQFCNVSACAACPAGRFNCDGVNDCETTVACGSTQCSPTTAGACGDNTRYCNVSACAPCPPNTFNCDGMNTCEANAPCGAACNPNQTNACGDSSKYCNNGSCTACPANTYNCDGLTTCESGVPCQAASCDAACQAQDRRWCMRNPARANACGECLTNAHCTSNPGAKGTVCDTNNLAGSQENFCICKAAADCVNNTQGRQCLLRPDQNNPAFTQCGCTKDADCPSAYPYCMYGDSKFTIGRCTPRCTKDADCTTGLGLGSGAYCSKSSGRCQEAPGP